MILLGIHLAIYENWKLKIEKGWSNTLFQFFENGRKSTYFNFCALSGPLPAPVRSATSYEISGLHSAYPALRTRLHSSALDWWSNVQPRGVEGGAREKKTPFKVSSICSGLYHVQGLGKSRTYRWSPKPTTRDRRIITPPLLHLQLFSINNIY